MSKFKLSGHFDSHEETGYHLISNGSVSIRTEQGELGYLQPIIDSLNNSGCDFIQTSRFEYECEVLKNTIKAVLFTLKSRGTNNNAEYIITFNDIKLMEAALHLFS